MQRGGHSLLVAVALGAQQFDLLSLLRDLARHVAEHLHDALGVNVSSSFRRVRGHPTGRSTRHSDSGSGLDGAEVTLVCRKASLSTSGGRKVLMRGRISGHAKTTNLGSRVIPAQPIVPQYS